MKTIFFLLVCAAVSIWVPTVSHARLVFKKPTLPAATRSLQNLPPPRFDVVYENYTQSGTLAPVLTESGTACVYENGLDGTGCIEGVGMEAAGPENQFQPGGTLLRYVLFDLFFSPIPGQDRLTLHAQSKLWSRANTADPMTPTYPWGFWESETGIGNWNTITGEISATDKEIYKIKFVAHAR